MTKRGMERRGARRRRRVRDGAVEERTEEGERGQDE